MSEVNDLKSNGMSDRVRLALLVVVMVLVASGIAAMSIWMLYSTSLKIETKQLFGMAESHVRILEAVARFDKEFSADDFPGGSRAATLSQVLDAFRNSEGFGEDGEYVIAERRGAKIVFLVSARQRSEVVEHTVPWNSDLAEPMRRALSGASGTVFAQDYAGVAVLAAYLPIAELNLGLVAKRSVAAIRNPYVVVAKLSVIGSMLILLVGIVLFRQIGNPMLRQQEAEEQYGMLLKSTAEAIYGIDLHGNCTFVNSACVQMLGYRDQSDLIGKNMHELTHHTKADGTEYPVDECKIYRAFLLGNGSHVDDELLWRADGSSFPAEYWSYPISRNGEMVGSVITFLDISIRRQAEASVRREKARLSAILDLAIKAVVCVDENQRIRIFNNGAEAIFGYAADEVLGQRVGMLLPENFRHAHENYVANFTRLDNPRRMGPQRQQVLGLRKDGSEFPAAVSISMIEVGGEKILTAALDDLTEKQQIDQKLQQVQKMEAVGQLTSGIAHDFNNILAIVMGNLELAEDAVKNDEDVRDYLSGALRGAQRGADLNRQLLTFSRQQVMEDKTTDVGEIVRGMTGLLKRTLGEDIEIETTVGARDCFSDLDPAQLESAILNLAINARDAMPQGGKLRIEVAISLPGDYVSAPDIEEEMVRISVSDTGTGMTEEVKGRALEPFFTTKAVGAGSGLGLSMVHGFVTQAGGELEINSEVEKGTTIHMMLPMAVAVENMSDTYTGSEWPRSANREVVLVVEDHREVRDVVVTYLGDLGYQVLEAEDGKRAIKILESFSSIDLILSDLVLPGGMRGEEVVEQAKIVLPDVKALYMSGNPFRSADSFGLDGRQISLLRKPFSKAALAQAVRACLDRAC